MSRSCSIMRHMRLIDRGTGPAIVFLHGTLMDHRMFEPQYTELSKSMRVIAYDLPARAPSAPREPYDLYDLAEDLLRVLDNLGIARCVVGGMSMGAFAALRFALNYPDRLIGLVLIGGQATAFSETDQAAWKRHYSSRQGQQVGLEFAKGEAEINFHADVAQRQPELIHEWTRRFAICDGDALVDEVGSWLYQDDVTERLHEVSVPSLIIHGDRDAAVPVAEAVVMYDLLPNARLLVLPSTGHAANLERPDQVNAAIRELVAETVTLDPPTVAD